MFRILLVLMLAIATSTGNAQDPCSEEYKKGGMISWKVCMTDFADESENEVEAVYRKLLNKLVYPKYLENSQSQWKSYVEKHCEFVATGAKGGTGQFAILSSCRNEMAEKRSKQLQEYLNCNDMGCPPLK